MEVTPIVKRRRRVKQVLSLGQRLQALAEQARLTAANMSPGKERDRLLSKAVEAENIIRLERWLTAPGLRAPS
jgi:hypothetical protein